MRLSSLSRKLKLKPSELELFYKKEGIKLLANSNSKLTDEQIKIALDYYNSDDEIEENLITIADSPSPISEQSIPAISNSKMTLDMSNSNDTEIDEENKKANTTVVNPLNDDDENIEVIKAPVVKLKGLTIKGKIELSKEKVRLKEKSRIKSQKTAPISPKFVMKNITSNSFNPLEEARRKKAKKERLLRKKRADQQKKEKKARYLKANPPSIKLSNKKSNKKQKNGSKTHTILDAPVKKMNQSRVSPNGNLNLLQRIWKWLNTY